MSIYPKVSVCMIAYNVEKYIEEAILGVLMQKVDFEVDLVISNDNSTDNTEFIIHRIMKKHPNGNWIKYYKQDTNLGMLPNYMWAFEKCNGKYLSICDSDDFWTDEKKLSKQVNFLEQNPKYILTFHNAFMIDEVGNIIQRSIEDYLKKDLDFHDLTKKVYPIPTASVIFRNDTGIKFPDEYLRGNNHDTFLYILIAQYGKLHYQEDVLPSAYRIHSKGTWTSKSKTDKSIHSLETFQNVRKVFPHEKGFRNMTFEFRNHIIVYSIKENYFFTFIKYYPINFFLSFTNKKYLKEFWLLHLKLFRK